MKTISTILATLFLTMNTLAQVTPAPDTRSGLNRNTAVEADRNDRNNNFYDNEETFSLPLSTVMIAGEVENPGVVDFSKLGKHSVIVKETLLNDDGSNRFVGAYRYDGYSLFDILNDRILKKKNSAEFKPIIDLYVEIENDLGEKIVLSWGEIYYPNYLHNCIIATDVMRIVPSKTKELWPLPVESRVVIAGDLITERNISRPTKITVRSYPRSFTITREMSPLTSPSFAIHTGNGEMQQVTELPATLQKETLHTVFYGKGRGIHSTQPFTGVYLKELLKGYAAFDRKNLKKMLVTIVGKDGYRSVYTLSEIMNRNDQAEILVVPTEEQSDGGKFRIFPSCDFFSDRAVKAISDIYIENPEK
jgi:hypothetical protein